ncbi:MAG TPA: hypothetical protein VNG53_05510 [Bacteroidia bacterium]|nr:hypothetical protein [Bacteroidia bacterium]
MISSAKKIFFTFALFLTVLLFNSCARRGYPSNPYLNEKHKPSDVLQDEFKRTEKQQLRDSKKLYRNKKTPESN